jgi:hypothetical protein
MSLLGDKMVSKIGLSKCCALTAALIVFTGLHRVASAATIAGWDLTQNLSGGSNGMPATTSAAGVITTSLTRNGNVTVSSASFSYDSKGWQSANTVNNVEASFFVSSAWNVTDLIFSAFRSGTGPSSVDVYTSVDGGSLNLFQTLTPANTGTGSLATNYDLALNLTVDTDLEVFFVADATGLATSSSGTLRLNNVSDNSAAADYFQFEGNQPVSVPLPASAAAGAIGMVIVGAGRIARRRCN